MQINFFVKASDTFNVKEIFEITCVFLNIYIIYFMYIKICTYVYVFVLKCECMPVCALAKVVFTIVNVFRLMYNRHIQPDVSQLRYVCICTIFIFLYNKKKLKII